MSAVRPIAADTAAHPLEALCHAIKAGDYSGLPAVDHEHWTLTQWHEAAIAALDCEDYSEVQWMIDDEAERSSAIVSQWYAERRSMRPAESYIPAGVGQ